MYIVSFTLIVLLPVVISQDAITAINGRINMVNLTATAARTEVTALGTRVTSLNNRLNSEFTYLNNYVGAVASNVSAVHEEVGANTAAVSDLSTKVDALAADLATANAKIVKLQAVNLIWQKNFRVVNKTFTELRKKVRFFVPRRGGQRVIGTVPLPLYFRPRPVGTTV